MLPLLTVTRDQKEHQISEDREVLANTVFHLTEDERKTLLPSGRQKTYNSRVHWARTYLMKAGLLQITGKGRYRITARGLDVLKDKPKRIDAEYLLRFPEFVEYYRPSGRGGDKKSIVDKGDKRSTPEEMLEAAYSELRLQLTQDILERVKGCSPSFFEQLVIDLLVKMGYGGSHKDAGEAIGKSGDGGIDGIIKEDKLGLDAIYIQEVIPKPSRSLGHRPGI